MHIKKHLSFDALVGSLSETINNIVEHRRKNSTEYSVHDVMMSSFACMYFQSPSVLEFQRQLELQTNRNNLKEQLIQSNSQILLMLIYIGDQPLNYQKIEEKIILILQRLQELYAKGS